ncbi:MAG: hypothetical protein ABR526_12785 [Chthoniobacterales bacterium]
MVLAARLLILSAVALTSCHTAKTAAVKTFRVIDAPARFVRERIDPPDQTTTTTTTRERTMASNSDVANPGRPISTSTPPPRSTPATRRTETESRANATPRPTTAARTETAATTTPRPSPSAPKSSTSAGASDFPTARAVPGKPGFVYSIDPKGGMIDVTGYKSGDKAKDPYTHQVFIVP